MIAPHAAAFLSIIYALGFAGCVIFLMWYGDAWRGEMTDRPQKITFAEMRDMGVRGVLIYCADYCCSHGIAVSADEWRRSQAL
jgi:hypothetical protein